MDSWRFLNTGLSDGPTNMAVDEALLRGVVLGTSPPTVRVYGWDPPTVSTGYAQDLEKELDLEACAAAGVGVVRRPTGGRAVLHAGELTYSVAGLAGRPPLGNTIMEAYLSIARALVAGVLVLGVEAGLAKTGEPGRARGEEASPPCFVSSGRFEVVVGGRKLIGSAQRRVGRGVLQHGSLLIDTSHERLAHLLRIRDERRRASVRRSLSDKTTDLSSILGRPVEFAEVARAVRAGFEGAWRTALDPAPLTEVELAVAEELATEHVTKG